MLGFCAIPAVIRMVLDLDVDASDALEIPVTGVVGRELMAEGGATTDSARSGVWPLAGGVFVVAATVAVAAAISSFLGAAALAERSVVSALNTASDAGTVLSCVCSVTISSDNCAPARKAFVCADFGIGDPRLMFSCFAEVACTSSDSTADSSLLFADLDWAATSSVGLELGVAACGPMGSTGMAGETGPGVATAVLDRIREVKGSCT